MAYYVSTSMIAILTGIIVFNIIQPGKNSSLADLQLGAEQVSTVEIIADQGLGATLWNQLFNLIPSNPFASLADPSNQSILGVIFFAIMFGVFITVVGGDTGDRLTRFFADAFAVMMRMTMFIIKAAPVGVLGFMLYASAGKGIEVFRALGWYALTVAVGLSIHAFITLPLILLLLARRSPWAYFQSMSPALLTAFSTASSNGTLPLTLTCVEERAGIHNRISSFVLPLGATINMDGTALYEAVAVLFIAQVTGNDLGLVAQVIVAFTALLASIGAAGIPHAGTIMMFVVLNAVGLPIEHVGLILAVDRVLDMYRTSINVWSDSTACAVMARMER
jgi:Na+/H+-dicarboxylate symporter